MSLRNLISTVCFVALSGCQDGGGGSAPADVAGPPKDASKTALGVHFKVLAAGTGEDKPAAIDSVRLRFRGWNSAGKLIDSSQEPAGALFKLNKVMPGWTSAITDMVVGEKRRLWVPERLAYRGHPGSPKGDLVFEVELVEIKAAPKAPDDVAAAPSDATKTASGLSYKVLRPGTGKAHPTVKDRVSVHYSGWTTDGVLFDSTEEKGEPSTLAISGVIPGWKEGLQLMVVGEKTRFWIPEALAYKGESGHPKGVLVFEIELLAIK